MSRHLLLLTMAVIFAGCATYPMGLNKEQWTALPLEKQAEYRAQQYKIDAEERRVAEERYQEQQRQAEEARRAEQARLEERIRNARYRDIITVTITGGVLESKDRSLVAAPVAFDLVRGETKFVKLSATSGRYTRTDEIKVGFSEDGNTVVLNDSALERDRITLVNQGWERGTTQTLRPFDGPGSDRWTGLTARLQFKALGSEPARVILERR